MAIFRTFHHGKMSAVELTCMRSFLDHGHQLTIFTYDPSTVDRQFRTADANQIVPYDKIFFYGSEPGKGSISGFSNLFRYTLLRQFGDFWTDTDVLCLAAKWPEQGDFVAGWESEYWIGSAVLKLPKALAEECISRCLELGDQAVWGQTGPRLVTELVVRDGLQSRLLPTASFYPRWHQQWLDFFDAETAPSARQASSGALAAHLWNQMLTQNRFRKELLPSTDSFFGAAVRRHGTQSYFEPCSDQDYSDYVRKFRNGAP
jgi:alpha 1,4-glycosyltransferase